MMLDDALAELPVVAILRGVMPDEVVAHAEALYAAGVRVVEVPLNSPDPLESVRRLADAWGGEMAVGAGTVLTPNQVEAVRDAGGQLVVAPNVDAAVIAKALELGLDAAPGVATATEAFAALSVGARHLKLFPASTYGPGHLKQLGAVLPDAVNVWAVGGVGPDAMPAWWAAGARAFGLGGELYRPGQSPEETGVRARRIALAAKAAASAS